MNDRTVEIFRTVLTVVGILLLVVFGSRAAAQARNMQLAGASHKSVFAVGTDIMAVLGFGKTQPVKIYEPKTLSIKVPAQIQPATPITTTPADTSSAINNKENVQSTAGSTSAQTNNGLHKAVGTVNAVSGKTQQVVNNITKNTTNDFTSLWP